MMQMNADTTKELKGGDRMESENSRRWQGALLLALLTWLLVAAAYRAAPAGQPGGTCIDFHFFYTAAQRLNHREPIYRLPVEGAYGYSPLLAELLRPLAQLPIDLAQRVWFAIETISMLLAAALYSRAVGLRLSSAVPIAIILIVGVRTTMTTMEYFWGNSNLILVPLLCGAVLADSRGRLRAVAVLIALAALIKVWMLGLVFYLALRRAWKEVGFAILAYATSIVLLFSLVGWREFPTFIRIVSGVAGLARMNTASSFPGFARFFLLGPDLLSHFIPYLAFILGGAVAVGGGLVYVARTIPEATPEQRRLHMNITMLSLLLMLPSCESFYYLLGLPALWELLTGANQSPKRYPATVFVGAVLAYIVLSHHWSFLHERVPVEFLAGAGLWALSLAALVASRRNAARGAAS